MEYNNNNNNNSRGGSGGDGGGGGGSKVTGIRQIVRLKEILQKWQTVTLSPINKGNGNNNDDNGQFGCAFESSSDAIPGGISPAITRRLMQNSGCYVDFSDDEGCRSPEPPVDVPRGYLAVYVGLELRRFIIPTRYLSDPLFKVLLEKAEEEFGFEHGGGLTIPCEIETFKYLLSCMESHCKDQQHSSNSNSTPGGGRREGGGGGGGAGTSLAVE